MCFWVYFVECIDGSIYIGQTGNLNQRIHAHKTGKGAKYVKAKGFKKVGFTHVVETRSDAMRLERRLKQLSHQDKIKIISGEKQIWQ